MSLASLLPSALPYFSTLFTISSSSSSPPPPLPPPSHSQIHQLGLPIRPAFWKDPRPSDELRAELGLEAEAPVAMVMGGGDGVGGMGAIAAAVIKTLAKELERSQVMHLSFGSRGGRGRGGGGRILGFRLPFVWLF